MQKEFVSICGEQVGEDMSLLETRPGFLSCQIIIYFNSVILN